MNRINEQFGYIYTPNMQEADFYQQTTPNDIMINAQKVIQQQQIIQQQMFNMPMNVIPKEEDTNSELERRLNIEVALFTSAAGINNVGNTYFRQFLANFRPDYKLPKLSMNLDSLLDETYLDIIDRMKSILRQVGRVTLMLNLISLHSYDSYVLCFSVGFEFRHNFEVMLLEIQNFEVTESKEVDLRATINQVLTKFGLNTGNLIKTSISGFEMVGIRFSNILVFNPFHCNYHRHLPKLLGSILRDNKLHIALKESVGFMAQSVNIHEEAWQRFEDICGDTIILSTISFDKLAKHLLSHRQEFLQICAQLALTTKVHVLTNEEWLILEEFSQLKDLTSSQMRGMKDNRFIITIDQVVPWLNKLLVTLHRRFKSLGQIPLALSMKVEETFSYILNSNDPNFQPIYLKSAFLGSYSSLTKEQAYLAVILLEKDANNIPHGKEQFKRSVRDYSDYISANHYKHQNTNPFEFWRINSQVYQKLSEFAIDLLCVPIEASLPVERALNSANEEDVEDLNGINLRPTNNYTYIKMIQNIDHLERNSIIRINQRVCYSVDKIEPIIPPVMSMSDPIFDSTFNSTFDPMFIEPKMPIIQVAKQEDLSEFIDIKPESSSSHKQRIRAPDDVLLNYNSDEERGRSQTRKRKLQEEEDRCSIHPLTRKYRTPLMMLYGVNQVDFNCRRLYNLLICYGDVKKIKFLRQKKDTVMIEMKNEKDAENVSKYLDNIRLFRRSLTFRESTSKMLGHTASHEHFEMKNGRSSFADYTLKTQKTKPFSESEAAKDMAYPSTQLYFSGFPTNYTQDDIKHVLSKYNSTYLPCLIITFQLDESSKSLTGIFCYGSVFCAGEALTIYNNVTIKGEHILRMRFTNKQIDSIPNRS